LDILTEAQLRSMRLSKETVRFSVKPDVFVTPLAKEYLESRGISLVIEEKSGGSFGKGVMTFSPTPENNADKFVDYYTGEIYDKKPEHMTHLRANLLVPKNDPRILFRGKLDSLEAHIMDTQITAAEEGYQCIADDLDELLEFVQNILACEVKDEPLRQIMLLDMDSERIRYVSHNVLSEIGVEHSVPHYSMGKMCVKLNLLRTFSRETELTAANAFIKGKVVERPDIIEALNRLSSCVDIIFCRLVAGKYRRGLNHQ
jgi:ethanolamine utilization cobalamin adenosyltransferase